jgi:predicted permease
MINPADNPARLALPADWRVLGFGMALTAGVTLLFGLAPALKASVTTSVTALKGGASPHSRRRLMRGLIVAQVAFCFIVLFAACLFAVTFDRLSKKPIGFEPAGLLTVEAVTPEPRPTAIWNQVSSRLHEIPGVEATALSGWPLLTSQANSFISINGAPPGPVLAYFFTISPGWLSTMKIPLLAGRDFRENDSARVAIVSQTFARTFFGTDEVIGKFYERGKGQVEIVGLTRDIPYRSLREPPLPVAYTRFDGQTTRSASFLVRTSITDPMVLASTIRRSVPAASTDLRVSNIQTELDVVRAQTIRERLLAALGVFFAALALVLAGIGLYGVLDYSVLQRRREIGIRMAIGAGSREIAWRVTADALAMVILGGGIGFGSGILLARYVEGLLYQVRPTNAAILAAPWVVIATATLIAALPAAIRAARTDPASSLRVD